MSLFALKLQPQLEGHLTVEAPLVVFVVVTPGSVGDPPSSGERNKNSLRTSGAITTPHFHHNLRIAPIGWSVCPWQAFPT
jgi:hypothetical protein